MQNYKRPGKKKEGKVQEMKSYKALQQLGKIFHEIKSLNVKWLY